MPMTLTTTYRVIATTTVGSGKPTTRTAWEGFSIDELSEEYPPSDVFGADPLGRSEIEGGHIITTYTFQQFVDGQWQVIDDPRVRLNPTLTDLERAIDAENRRDFPGDYITADDDDPYDEPCCNLCDDYGCAACDPEPYYDPDCYNCDDRGCEQCDPRPDYDCKSCRDQGCGLCIAYEEPEDVKCGDCGELVDPMFINAQGVCVSCEEDLKPRCCYCGQTHTDPILKDEEPCASCGEDMARWEAEGLFDDEVKPQPWYIRFVLWLLGPVYPYTD